MRFSTHIAGAAVAAMVAMTAIPNDAAAVPIASGSSFGFVPVGAVTFNTGSDIALGITTKTYPAAIVNVPGNGSFTGIINAGNAVAPTPLVFDVPTGIDDPVGPFSITVSGFTFTFTEGDLHNLTPSAGGNAGSLVADYQGTVTAAPGPWDTGQVVQLSQSCDQALPAAPVNCSNTLIVEPGQIPEPASMALLGTALVGLGGLGFFRRRRNAA